MKTGRITYNVRERGRQFRGTARNFDTGALARVVMDGAVQERVRNRDLWGYYGHWPRMVFGLDPGEGGPVQSGPLAGKVIRLEPTHVTTYLDAAPDGTITHEAEFLDNPPGRLAARAFGNKTAGFSSVINARPTASGADVPIGFHGFDFVSEPNFTKNRGWVLDGVVEDEAGALLDDAISESNGALRILDGLYSDLLKTHAMQADTINRLSLENAELVDILAKRPVPEQQAALARVARLDDARFTPARRLMTLDSAALVKMSREFRAMGELPGFEPRESPEQKAGERKLYGLADSLLRQFRR
ncbi:MAG: hypothetical protein MUE35_10500 [Hydrogenophaga sp.]|jgi:hypothetical protein|nr:hypothetical protein [Hydrogenophaga sp.]